MKFLPEVFVILLCILNLSEAFLGPKSMQISSPRSVSGVKWIVKAKTYDQEDHSFVPQSFSPTNPNKSSFTVSTINLLKNCVGAGVFSLSAKLLSVSNIANRGLIPQASGLIFVLALWASYNFYIVSETCKLTGVSTYGDCWGETVSPKSKWLIQVVTNLGPLIGSLACTIVLTDLLGGIMQGLHLPVALSENRVAVVLLLCGCILYPLCSLQDLKALQGTSLLGLAGQVIAMVVVALRVLDRSYLSGGVYAASAPVLYVSGLSTTSVSATALVNAAANAVTVPMESNIYRWFVFTSLLSYCFVTHYNAPKYYAEMENPTSTRMFSMTLLAYLGAALFYASSMWLGIQAFGATCKPYLLNNLSSEDPLALLARVAIALSVLATTPLMFMNVRNTLIGLAQPSVPVLASVRPMTAALVLCMGVLATQVTDIGVIGSIAGGLLGTNMMFTIPPIMYLQALRRRAQKTGTTVAWPTVLVHAGLALIGGILSAVGTYHSVIAIFK